MTEEEIQENFNKLAKERVFFKAAEFYEGKLDDNNKPMDIVAQIDRDANPIDNVDEKEEKTEEETEEESGGEEGGGEESPSEEEIGGGEEPPYMEEEPPV